MGQRVGIVKRRVLQPGVVRYDLDHSLSGTSHESYVASVIISGDRPTDILARRIFETGGVKAVHVHSNVVTVTFEPSVIANTDGEDDDQRFQKILIDLYTHYLPGVRPTPV